MALIATLAALLGAAALGFVFTALGRLLLRAWRLEFESCAERLLCCAAVGVIAFEAGVAAAEFTGKLRIGVAILLFVSAALGAFEFQSVYRDVAALARCVARGSSKEHLLAALVALVLLFEGISAMAPLTGSDALHYHFTAPLLTLRNGFQPDFFLAHGFFTGQSHLLILTGLALGSEKLSLGLIFLGGVLAAAAGACLTRKWASREWAWLAALTFLLTPVVFWQISASGAPDVWAAFFATTGVLVIARAKDDQRLGLALLAGILAGAVAGVKYTGCIIAASLALAFLWEARSPRRLSVFFCGALGAGLWPYVRNARWTGDPFFPFLLHWFAPGRMNAYTLASIMGDTGAATPRSLWQVAKFPFFAAVDLSHAGFWQFFGPLCLAFAPLVIWAARNTSLWRTALIVWIVSSIGIGATSGMLRFALPILPVALGMVFAGAAALSASEWRIARGLSTASIAVFLLLSAGGLIVYERSAAAAAIGLTDRETYLKQRAPDYGKTQFVNETLEGKGSEGKALVFFRHVYYLRVPFLYGDPAASWSIDPKNFQTPQAWRTLFHAQNIRWVVRAPDYPPAIAAALGRLEATGKLEPFAQSEVSNFEGLRILGVRKTQPIVILRVKD